MSRAQLLSRQPFGLLWKKNKSIKLSPDLVVHWITEWGSLGLLALLALGMVGLPVPDETLLAYAGLFIARGVNKTRLAHLSVA